MKKRQIEVLDCVFHNKSVSIDSLLETFQISKRTLYYDIAKINEEIAGYGEIKNKKKELVFYGLPETASYFLKEESVFEKEERLHHLLYAILNEEFDKIESVMKRLQVSKNTVVNDIVEIRKELSQYELQLEYRGGYRIQGAEKNVRELYMKLMACDNTLIQSREEAVLEFDRLANLRLTDYSVAMLSKFVGFIRKRNRKGCFIEPIKFAEEAKRFSHYKYIKEILEFDKKEEIEYLTLYIATLPSLKTNVSKEIIKNYVDSLVRNFENLSAVKLNNSEEFKKNIQRHIQSSYYRIKYNFPCFNPGLEDIRVNHPYLFRLVKQVVDLSDNIDFKDIRDEEIAFLAMYFGGNLRATDTKAKNRVLIICPSGLMMSKMLEAQIRNYIPMIHIVDVISIHDRNKYCESDFDYIVSTIPLDGEPNVIVVKPILTKQNIDTLIHKMVNIPSLYQNNVLDKVWRIIEENCQIKNEERLRKHLSNLLLPCENKREEQPMLKEVLTRGRMNRVKSCPSWEEAIRMAAQPLLEEELITERYVELMIENVNKFGPYMVLEDGFALPHASEKEGVNEFSMSYLFVEEAVDLKGKPIHAFVVLATVDNTTHLRALASLSRILESEEGLEAFLQGDLDKVEQMIQQEK